MNNVQTLHTDGVDDDWLKKAVIRNGDKFRKIIPTKVLQHTILNDGESTYLTKGDVVDKDYRSKTVESEGGSVQHSS